MLGPRKHNVTSSAGNRNNKLSSDWVQPATSVGTVWRLGVMLRKLCTMDARPTRWRRQPKMTICQYCCGEWKVLGPFLNSFRKGPVVCCSLDFDFPKRWWKNDSETDWLTRVMPAGRYHLSALLVRNVFFSPGAFRKDKKGESFVPEIIKNDSKATLAGQTSTTTSTGLKNAPIVTRRVVADLSLCWLCTSATCVKYDEEVTQFRANEWAVSQDGSFKARSFTYSQTVETSQHISDVIVLTDPIDEPCCSILSQLKTLLQ